MTEEQLQAIKERNQQLLDDGIVLFRQDIEASMGLVAEVELQKANAEQYLRDNVNLHNENLILSNEIQRMNIALDRTELAEAKARIEIEAIDGYYSALLKKRVLQVEEQEKEIERLRSVIWKISDDCDLSIMRTNKYLAGEPK